jgi:hypothetical protein
LDYDLANFVAGSVASTEGKIIEGHKLFGRLDSARQRARTPVQVTAADHGGAGNFDSRIIDTSWLEAASETYKISNRLEDFVISDVPILTASIPNKNMQAFTEKELLYFDPMLHNMVFKTFVRSAMHFEHDNRDPLKAKGCIFDAVFIPVPKYGLAKVSILIGCDRTKDPDLAKDILTRKRTGWSMGAIVKAFVDSITGQVVSQDGGEYKRGTMVQVGDEVKLCYHLCTGSNFFETSTVANPADVTAHGFMMGMLTSV